MIKTTYQTPEIRDSSDNIIQQGAFGKNTALSNSTNDGWIDYVVNNLEALHDTIGDSAAHLDGNGHVVEPANLAIGDEDGNRLKTSYLKLSGGNVTGIASFRADLRMLDNQDNRFGGLYVPASSSTQQYMQFYSGTRATGDARLTLYPSGDGHFSLLAYSNNGGNNYELRNDNNGNLNWRGYPLAWKKDYLPLAGGTMTGMLKTSSEIRFYTDSGRLSLIGGNTGGAYLNMYGKDHGTWPGLFSLTATDGTTNYSLQGASDGTLKWRGYDIALAKDVLPLAGGTMTGNIRSSSNELFVLRKTDNLHGIQLWSGTSYNDGASISLYGKGYSQSGVFNIGAYGENTFYLLHGEPNGTLTWGGKNIERIESSGTNYIRYTNGLQICWRNGASFDTNGTQIVFPVPFKDATYAVNVTGRGLTTSTNIGILKVTTKDSAGFVAMAVATNNISSFAGGTLDYIAIGLWK